VTAVSTGESLEVARGVADAVLFEGYMLYPYRANDPKNRIRWQFGVLAPPAFASIDASERSHLQTECLLEGRPVTLAVQVRFLQVQRRAVERVTADGFAPSLSLDVGAATYLPWDEAVVHESTLSFALPLPEDDSETRDLHVDAGTHVELLRDANGVVAGRLVRERWALDARLDLSTELLPGPYGVRRLRLRLENRTDWSPPGTVEPDRPDALRSSLVAAHLLLAAPGGAFVSLIDPPEWASGYAATCVQTGVFPVLAGRPETRELVLASPIILYDHPQIAPESNVEFCDATEMDEMLTLRTMTLTEQEKREVRGSDARGAELVDQLEQLPPELMDRLHGAIRSMTAVARRFEGTPVVAPSAAPPPDPLPEVRPWWNPAEDDSVDPDTDCVLIGGVAVTRGTPVRLRPGRRRADAQDMFLAGRLAHVEAVLSDVDGGRYLAVTLDELAELAEDGYNPHGRFLYFAPDEVEPMVWP
jgi:hypothetical protein